MVRSLEQSVVDELIDITRLHRSVGDPPAWCSHLHEWLEPEHAA